jgi:polysaccharide pyruvyl transferase WcaK-like protein
MAAVLLAGAFGQRNPGDEALLRAFVEGLPDHALVATSVDPSTPRPATGSRRSIAATCAPSPAG